MIVFYERIVHNNRADYVCAKFDERGLALPVPAAELRELVAEYVCKHAFDLRPRRVKVAPVLC